ncbi:hypothetical protein [Gluconacetobacter tumulicola]|uniref:Uncharacterized protein n=1 Tax=Gluconacetobacter tumulicola TaxID=1017177 RepID=A0A7W4P830_9PROT|nr:hypothetical protein [Gluconacetobacter tumulicola]MBB2180584.1 hypothetical protein [Gluconacetobacter tumulicola]
MNRDYGRRTIRNGAARNRQGIVAARDRPEFQAWGEMGSNDKTITCTRFLPRRMAKLSPDHKSHLGLDTQPIAKLETENFHTVQ